MANSIHRIGLAIAGLVAIVTVAGVFVVDGYRSAQTSAALAAACFVKAFGIPFLALPRSEAAATAEEAEPAMQNAMAFLAAACFFTTGLMLSACP